MLALSKSGRLLIRGFEIDFADRLAYPRIERGGPGGRPIHFSFRGMSDEAHLPAEQSRAQAASRLPGPQGDRRRTQGPGGAPRPRPQDLVRVTSAGNGLITLSRRADFLAANKGRRAAMPGFVLLVRQRGDDDPAIRLGIT